MHAPAMLTTINITCTTCENGPDCVCTRPTLYQKAAKEHACFSQFNARQMFDLFRVEVETLELGGYVMCDVLNTIVPGGFELDEDGSIVKEVSSEEEAERFVAMLKYRMSPISGPSKDMYGPPGKYSVRYHVEGYRVEVGAAKMVVRVQVTWDLYYTPQL